MNTSEKIFWFAIAIVIIFITWVAFFYHRKNEIYTPEPTPKTAINEPIPFYPSDGKE